MNQTLRIALTPGEPAGIGPDLAILMAQQSRDFELVAIASAELLRSRAAALGVELTIRDYDATVAPAGDSTGTLCVHDRALGCPATIGELDVRNAEYVLDCLQTAVEGCSNNSFQALVTGPVHKAIINDAGIPFSGHTEFIAEHTSAEPVMMLAAGDFRVALATTHLPLSEVASALTTEVLERVCRILYQDLQAKFNVSEPRVLVCGLNPHAGEGGHLGDEEINIIQPVLERLRGEGMQFEGPLPADTLFTPKHLKGADATLAMFHDQGLPVLKYAGFGSAVNITLGLPVIRTSVDHGTAIDLAGSGKIDSGSMQAAIDLAVELASNATKHQL